MQFILALFVFQTSVGNDIFQWMATFAEGFLGYSWFGTSFVFGDAVANSGVVAVTIFPPIIFFAAVVQMLYYVGAIQFLLRKVSVACAALLKVTGAEAVVVVASVIYSHLIFFLFTHFFFFSLSLVLLKMLS